MKTIYNDLSFENNIDREIAFYKLFDNTDSNNYYILIGDIELWNGVIRNAYHQHVFTSLADAIAKANDRCDGYIIVSEDKYGKLFVNISHHDGNNNFEIRELTKIGEEMYNNYKSIQEIINRKGSTRNVKFLKNYS